MTSSLFARTCTSSLLVAGTCIGGGMLALPLASAPGGFFPSITYMAIVWLSMTLTGLCLVEIGLWMKKEDVHLASMASAILGQWGKFLVWILFLFISYASLAAYTGGCGNLVAKGLSSYGFDISKNEGSILFILFATPFILGPRALLGKANDVIFIFMILAYFVIISQGLGTITVEYVCRKDWGKAYLSIPLLITAFSCQMMIPSLHSFLHNHKKALQTAVISGTTLAFLVYVLWQLVIFGSIPLEGEYGLNRALSLDEPATYCLEHITHSPIISKAAGLFALFALITSFFGIGMGLYDFLSDGIGIQKKGKGSFFLTLLVLIPSLYFSIRFENIFITALDISGGFGDTILNGIIPLLMIWIGTKTLFSNRICWTKTKYALFFILFFLYAGAFTLETYVRCTSAPSTVDNRASGIE